MMLAHSADQSKETSIIDEAFLNPAVIFPYTPVFWPTYQIPKQMGISDCGIIVGVRPSHHRRDML